MSHWIALFLAIAGNVGGNIAFKHFVQTTDFQRSWILPGGALWQPSLWIGGLFAATLLVCYLYAIRTIPLGVAYTVATSISIAGVTCAGVLLYGEAIGLRTAIGIAVVMAGVVLITTA
jgi:multidrug transporter EmrE-like cation transporter